LICKGSHFFFGATTLVCGLAASWVCLPAALTGTSLAAFLTGAAAAVVVVSGAA